MRKVAKIFLSISAMISFAFLIYMLVLKFNGLSNYFKLMQGIEQDTESIEVIQKLIYKVYLQIAGCFFCILTIVILWIFACTNIPVSEHMRARVDLIKANILNRQELKRQNIKKAKLEKSKKLRDKYEKRLNKLESDE